VFSTKILEELGALLYVLFGERFVHEVMKYFRYKFVGLPEPLGEVNTYDARRTI
jgi:hypothetical protein